MSATHREPRPSAGRYEPSKNKWKLRKRNARRQERKQRERAEAGAPPGLMAGWQDEEPGDRPLDVSRADG